MFVCQFCGRSVPPRTPAIRVVVDRRPKQYPLRRDANAFRRPAPDGRMKDYTADDPGGVGWEIASEWLACPACAAEPPSG